MTNTPQPQPRLVDLIDAQTRADLERAYLAVQTAGNKLNQCQRERTTFRARKARFSNALRQFRHLVRQASPSQPALSRAA